LARWRGVRGEVGVYEGCVGAEAERHDAEGFWDVCIFQGGDVDSFGRRHLRWVMERLDSDGVEGRGVESRCVRLRVRVVSNDDC
jgi:hypothetical protein